jgi:hypothetical protein
MESEDSFDGYLEEATELQHRWFNKFLPTEEDKMFGNIESFGTNEEGFNDSKSFSVGTPSSVNSNLTLTDHDKNEDSLFVKQPRNFKNSICKTLRCL